MEIALAIKADGITKTSKDRYGWQQAEYSKRGAGFKALFLFMVLLLLVSFSCRPLKDATSPAEKNYRTIFDGKTLNGWEYDPVYWRVEDGKLVGEVTPANLLKRNSFIIKKDLVTKDFDLLVEYRVSADGNSGINYRSETIDSLPYAMRGYQSDIDGKNLFTGQNYEERGRTTLAYHGQKVVVNQPEIPWILKTT
jgi:hypothetical protein